MLVTYDYNYDCQLTIYGMHENVPQKRTKGQCCVLMIPIVEDPSARKCLPDELQPSYTIKSQLQLGVSCPTKFTALDRDKNDDTETLPC